MTDLTIFTTLCNNRPERLGYLIRTISSFKKHLVLTKYTVKWIVSSELKFTINKKETEEFCKENNIQIYYNPGKDHLATNQNFGLSKCDSNYIFFLQDDYECMKDVNLDDAIDFLKMHDNICVIRYWFAHIKLKNEYFDKQLRIKLFDLNSGFYYYGDNPHLKKATFHKITGPFNDSGTSRMCENDMCDRCRKISDRYKICAIDDAVHGVYFSHIGTESSVADN
jgi:hypothetical protein